MNGFITMLAEESDKAGRAGAGEEWKRLLGLTGVENRGI